MQRHSSFAIHPGPWLRRNVIHPYGLNVTTVAKHLRVTRPAMSNLLNGKAGLSADMAIRFEKAFGISAATLVRMQAAYDLAAVQASPETVPIARLKEPKRELLDA